MCKTIIQTNYRGDSNKESVSRVRSSQIRQSFLRMNQQEASTRKQSRTFFLLIQSLNKTRGITFVIITHDDEVAHTADRVYRMHDGVLKEGGVQRCNLKIRSIS